MAIYKTSELYNKLGISANSFAVYKQRKKVIVIDGYVDTENPVNKLFISKFEKKQKKSNENNSTYDELKKRGDEKLKEYSEKVPKLKEKDNNSYDLSALEKARALKYNEEIDILKIKKAKMEGELLPFDAVKLFFMNVVETFYISYSQESKSLANIMVNRFGGGKKELIEVQKDLQAKLESIKSNTVKEIEKGIENIIDEYSEVRGRGERK